jgi:transposase
MPMAMSCGIDWSEDHHDVAVVDADGRLVAKRRIGDDAAGYGQLLEVLAGAGDRPETPIPVAIETARGLLVACLRATGRPIYAINPLAVARYRERHAVSGKKSDHADAVVLANILRTDRAAHRPLPADSELVRAIAVLARAQQDAVWDRTQAHHKLRSLLREYYPGFLAAFGDLRGGILRPEARVLLASAPTPADAARLTPPELVELLRQAGRQRRLPAHAARLHATFAAPCLRQPPLVEQAMGQHALALLGALNTACAPTPRSWPPRPARRSTGTPTPRSSPALSVLVSSPAPGCWPSSAMTAPASRPPKRSRPTPAPPRSPAPAARACWSPTDG